MQKPIPVTCTHILAFDPAGNFHEGKGNTGWALMEVASGKVREFGYIDAATFRNIESYWQAHLDLINQMKTDYTFLHIVMEDFFLYANKAKEQTNSRMETPQLIGCIRLHCYRLNLKLEMQTATSVKTRWPDEILVRKGYLTQLPHGAHHRYYITSTEGDLIMSNNHMRDAIRHAVHYLTFAVKRGR